VTVLTHPTLAGVSASFAFLGDVIIAEPKAMIGFTGARVIEQTIKKKLPVGFQESEFLLEHGQIDMVLHRSKLRVMLSKLVAFATHQPLQTSGQAFVGAELLNRIPVLVKQSGKNKNSKLTKDTAKRKKSPLPSKTKAKVKTKVKPTLLKKKPAKKKNK
jgi:hypothetical protein